MPPSNTKDCFRHCVGKRVTGVLFDAFPLSGAKETRSLILDDGTALTMTESGTFWINGTGDVLVAIDRAVTRLKQAKAELAEALILAGVSDV